MQGARFLLEIEGLSKSFRGLLAVDKFSLQLNPGEILGIIGPNGAGKTTVFNLVTGYIRPTRGQIRFDGHDITRLPPHKIAALGIARTFQNIRLFPTMSVLDNVKSAQQLRDADNLFTTLLSWPSFLAREKRLAARSLEQLAYLNWPTRPMSPPPACPTETSAVWRLSGLSPCVPSCFSWMNRPPE